MELSDDEAIKKAIIQAGVKHLYMFYDGSTKVTIYCGANEIDSYEDSEGTIFAWVWRFANYPKSTPMEYDEAVKLGIFKTS